MTGFKTISKVYNYLYLTYRHVDHVQLYLVNRLRIMNTVPSMGWMRWLEHQMAAPPPPGLLGLLYTFIIIEHQNLVLIMSQI